MAEKRNILDTEAIKRTITRIAHEIIEKNKGTDELALIGIRTGGVWLANRIQSQIKEISNAEVPVGIVDITMYRDDLSEIGPQPEVGMTEINFDLYGKKVILVDDVLYTGRTIRAAIDELIDFGRPKYVQLAVLVDRGHRELPIRADYVGKNIPTAEDEEVVVRLAEDTGKDEVFVVKREKHGE